MYLAKKATVISLTVVALLLITICSYADFTVRTIYFQPTDAPAAPVEKIRNAMEHTQNFYADEMQRHKFGRKTFRLEHAAGKVVVHTVKGRHAANHYRNDTAGTLDAELPSVMKNRNDILISFIGGLDGVAGGWNGQGQAWFGHDCGACKGWAAVADKNGDFAESTVAHELGHAFGLYHNLAGKKGADFLMWFDGELDFYEARLLNKSRYFNTSNHIVKPPPRISNPKRPETIQRDNKDYVGFSVGITTGQGLYQAQLFRDSDLCVLDWTRLSGQSDTAIFEINRAELIGESRVWIHAQDNDGNQSVLPIDFSFEKPDYSTEGTATYLTLNYDGPDALTPTNPQHEWGWDWGGWQQTWEKTPDGKLPPKPHQGFAAANTIPFTQEWDYWFYGHYPSRIVYDLSGGHYTKFDAYFDMPNPCTHIATPASIEVKIFADDIEVYHSGVWKGDEARNTHISFNLPEDTQTLAINVSDAGDGGVCDHFIFANARLLSEAPESEMPEEDSYDTKDKPNYETSGKATYLTLNSNHHNAIVPKNNSAEWAGWIGLLWEKTPEGQVPSKPQYYVNIATGILDKWDYWFYSHASSRIVYDLTDKKYTKFNAYFFMPNPCGETASVEIICHADGTEIYHSGVLRQVQNMNISFDIPADTQELTINVTEGGDGDTCDHFIFANAYLAYNTSGVGNYTDNNTDVNSDGAVNIVDLVLVAARYGEQITGSPNINPDVDRSGKVDINDLVLVATAIDNANSVYSAPAQPLAPIETVLLPNYPNPFNPETWIPYQLSKDSNVTITIYDTRGVFVRGIPLGFQYAGFYTNRSRAAYWDGRNEIGEPVASGIYFYQLQTDNVSLLRKMLNLK